MSDKTSQFINAIADKKSNRITGWAIHGGKIDCPMVTLMWIGPGELWTGGTPAMDYSIVEHFDKILCLYPWEPYPTLPDQEVVNVELYDSLDQVFDQVEELSDLVKKWLEDENRVLVHCQAGLNRSSLVSALTIMKISGMRPKDVIFMMRQRRSNQVLCNSSFENYVLNWWSGIATKGENELPYFV